MVMFAPGANLPRPRPPVFVICLEVQQAPEIVMPSNRRNPDLTQSIDTRRRDLLSAAGAGIATATLSGGVPGSAGTLRAQPGGTVLRWGVVGTGGIANSMAPRIREAEGAALSAVSSRRIETAREFAEEHSVTHAFDSWQEMIESEQVDAVYIATPTSVRWRRSHRRTSFTAPTKPSLPLSSSPSGRGTRARMRP